MYHGRFVTVAEHDIGEKRGKGFWEIKYFFVDSVLNYRWGSLKNRELVEIFAFGSDKVFEFYRRWIFCKFEHCRICIEETID